MKGWKPYMGKEETIREILAFDLDWNDYDHETGEEELIGWVLDTHKMLQEKGMNELQSLLQPNSLKGE